MSTPYSKYSMDALKMVCNYEKSKLCQGDVDFSIEMNNYKIDQLGSIAHYISSYKYGIHITKEMVADTLKKNNLDSEVEQFWKRHNAYYNKHQPIAKAIKRLRSDVSTTGFHFQHAVVNQRLSGIAEGLKLAKEIMEIEYDDDDDYSYDKLVEERIIKKIRTVANPYLFG